MSACAKSLDVMSAGAESTLGWYSALVRGTTDYWAGAFRRRSTAIDVYQDLLDWWATAGRRDQPQWASENETVAEWSIARLRDFSARDAPDAIATLLLPPQAGGDSCIVDFATHQSQVKTALDAGLPRVFALDWIGATQATKDVSIEDYIAVIDEAVDRVGGRINLVGDCQGGWLAAIYAALRPESINTLTVAGAPIDCHAGELLIYDWLKVLTPTQVMAFHRSIVAANGGVFPGWLLLAGFIAMHPQDELDRQLQLLAHIHEAEHVERYRLFETWFRHTQAIPGAFSLWSVEHLFLNNELIAGTVRVGTETVDLGRITCPIYLLAGAEDTITPPPQVFALAQYVGTEPDQIVQRLTTGGHLGLFMGHEALRNHWAPVFEQIATR